MPRRTEAALTDAKCKNAKPKAARYSLPDGLTPGLELRVTPAGVKTWSFRYWTEDRQLRRVSFGPYPARELWEARKLANAARNSVSDGKDPAGEKKTRIAEARARSIKTFADLADAYFTDATRKKAASTIEGEQSRYRTHLKPKLGGLAVDKVSRANVRAMAEAAADSGGGVAANRCIALVSVIYTFAQTGLDLEMQNPALKIGRVFQEQARGRVLSDPEIKTLWAALDDPASVGAQLAPATALAFKLQFLTAQRPGEIAGLDVRELDLKQRLWIIPAARAKNRREHVVPLSDPALAIIEDALALAGSPKSGPLFPSPRGRNKDMTPKERDAAAKQITRHALSRAMNRLCDKAKIEDCTPHDMRRTGATLMASERLGISRYIVSRCLNHTSDTGGAATVTAQVYARSDDLPAKRAALAAWAQLLAQIVSGESTQENVVPLRRES